MEMHKMKAFNILAACDAVRQNSGEPFCGPNTPAMVPTATSYGHSCIDLWWTWLGRAWDNMIRFVDKALPIALPTSPARAWWTVWMLCVVLYVSVDIPLHIAFKAWREMPWIFPVGIMTTVSFCVDVIVHFRTAYTTPQGEVVRTPRLIVLHYLRGMFVLDLTLAVPVDEIVDVTMGGTGHTNAYWLGLLRLPRLIIMLRQLDYIVPVKYGVFVSVGKLLLVMLLSTHWAACIWYYLTLEIKGGWPWVFTVECESQTDLGKYLFAFYRSFLLLLGDRPRAYNNVERIFVLVLLFLGACLYAVIMGSMTLLVTNMWSMASRHKQRAAMLQDALRYKGASAAGGLRARIDSYFDFMAQCGHPGGDGVAVLSELPTALHAELMSTVFEPLLTRIQLFAFCERPFLWRLAQRLRLCMYMPRDFIYDAGSVGHDMYVIWKGAVVLMEADSTTTALLTQGDHFGELGVMSTSTPRPQRAVAMCATDMLLLSRSDLLEAMRDFPDSAEIVKSRARVPLEDHEIGPAVWAASMAAIQLPSSRSAEYDTRDEGEDPSLRTQQTSHRHPPYSPDYGPLVAANTGRGDPSNSGGERMLQSATPASVAGPATAAAAGRTATEAATHQRLGQGSNTPGAVSDAAAVIKRQQQPRLPSVAAAPPECVASLRRGPVAEGLELDVGGGPAAAITTITTANGVFGSRPNSLNGRPSFSSEDSILEALCLKPHEAATRCSPAKIGAGFCSPSEQGTNRRVENGSADGGHAAAGGNLRPAPPTRCGQPPRLPPSPAKAAKRLVSRDWAALGSGSGLALQRQQQQQEQHPLSRLSRGQNPFREHAASESLHERSDGNLSPRLSKGFGSAARHPSGGRISETGGWSVAGSSTGVIGAEVFQPQQQQSTTLIRESIAHGVRDMAALERVRFSSLPPAESSAVVRYLSKRARQQEACGASGPAARPPCAASAIIGGGCSGGSSVTAAATTTTMAVGAINGRDEVPREHKFNIEFDLSELAEIPSISFSGPQQHLPDAASQQLLFLPPQPFLGPDPLEPLFDSHRLAARASSPGPAAALGLRWCGGCTVSTAAASGIRGGRGDICGGDVKPGVTAGLLRDLTHIDADGVPSSVALGAHEDSSSTKQLVGPTGRRRSLRSALCGSYGHISGGGSGLQLSPQASGGGICGGGSSGRGAGDIDCWLAEVQPCGSAARCMQLELQVTQLRRQLAAAQARVEAILEDPLKEPCIQALLERRLLALNAAFDTKMKHLLREILEGLLGMSARMEDLSQQVASASARLQRLEEENCAAGLEASISDSARAGGGGGSSLKMAASATSSAATAAAIGAGGDEPGSVLVDAPIRQAPEVQDRANSFADPLAGLLGPPGAAAGQMGALLPLSTAAAAATATATAANSFRNVTPQGGGPQTSSLRLASGRSQRRVPLTHSLRSMRVDDMPLAEAAVCGAEAGASCSGAAAAAGGGGGGAAADAALTGNFTSLTVADAALLAATMNRAAGKNVRRRQSVQDLSKLTSNTLAAAQQQQHPQHQQGLQQQQELPEQQQLQQQHHFSVKHVGGSAAVAQRAALDGSADSNSNSTHLSRPASREHTAEALVCQTESMRARQRRSTASFGVLTYPAFGGGDRLSPRDGRAPTRRSGSRASLILPSTPPLAAAGGPDLDGVGDEPPARPAPALTCAPSIGMGAAAVPHGFVNWPNVTGTSQITPAEPT